MRALVTQVLLPLVTTFASVLIPLLVAFIAQRFHAWTGMEMEAKHRQALQSALANAAKIVLAGATMQAGVDYVLASVPDALKALKVDGGAIDIESLLAPHIATGQIAAVASK